MLFKQEPDTRKHGSFSSHTTSAATTPRRRPQLSPPPQDQACAPRPSGKPQLGGSKGDVDPAGRRGQGPDPWGARCGEVGLPSLIVQTGHLGAGPTRPLCCAVPHVWVPRGCRAGIIVEEKGVPGTYITSRIPKEKTDGHSETGSLRAGPLCMQGRRPGEPTCI